MQSTASKAKQHLQLDPLMVASLVENVLAQEGASDAKSADNVSKLIKEYNQRMMLTKNMQVDGNMAVIVSKILQAPPKLVEHLRSIVSEFGFSVPFSYGMMAFNGFWPKGGALKYSTSFWFYSIDSAMWLHQEMELREL